MYGWLAGALKDSSQVVTASRRLSRVLVEQFGQQQLAAGRIAWRTPAIRSWAAWQGETLATAAATEKLPTRINSQQSRILWERCLSREINDPLLNVGMLVRQAQETWARLHEWQVSIADCEQSSAGQDQRIFTRAARSYQSILEREFWIDDDGLAGLLIELIDRRAIELPSRLVLAGFDRIVPQVQALINALEAAGCGVSAALVGATTVTSQLHSYDNVDAEMRAAGAWARRVFDNSPDTSIGIISSNLDQDGARQRQLVQEGLVPGWQYSGPQFAAAVNVSYGQSMLDYPAIGVAMRALRWLQTDLSSKDVSLLLRSPMLASDQVLGRARLELVLRDLPDRSWSPSMLLGALSGRDDTPDSLEFIARIQGLAERRKELPGRESPSVWATTIDAVLRELGWPGTTPLNSIEFQLINRWRDLLNDFARLELVSASMTFAEALARLSAMASDVVFQAESDGAVVHLMGPLEAAGMQFDDLWISGLTADNWPPASRPLALVSRDLQRSRGMPDAEPQDTMDYAQRVIDRMTHSASSVVLSYAESDGDVEQTVSDLIDVGVSSDAAPADPSWHASSLLDLVASVCLNEDPVPPVTVSERIAGGATTIQRQLSDPFSAFAFGRLLIKSLSPIENGLSPILRGNLIHDALQYLYRELPSQPTIADWGDAERQQRIKGAVDAAFARHERHVDSVLAQLLQFERQRVATLLDKLVSVDVARGPFNIEHVEKAVQTILSGVSLNLRIDRIDRQPSGTLTILDYKTGAKKRFLDRSREPTQIQLVVYACALDDAIGALGLINIDSRSIDIDGAGSPFAAAESWDEDLRRWKSLVLSAAAALQRGDVRTNVVVGSDSARPLGLLSRIEELRHD